MAESGRPQLTQAWTPEPGRLMTLRLDSSQTAWAAGTEKAAGGTVGQDGCPGWPGVAAGAAGPAGGGW